MRERLNLSPGQKVQALVYDGRVELIPVRPAKALRGFLKGIDTAIARDADRARGSGSVVTRARPNVVDSSAWLAYFADEPSASRFAPAIEDVRRLVVPTVCLLEVFKVVAWQRGEGDALQAVAIMQQAEVVEIDAALALSAARLGLDHKLPLADSIVYATARGVGGVVWTQDEDFDGLPDVQYVPKRRG